MSIYNIKFTYKILKKKFNLSLSIITILILLTSFFEIIGIGLILPLIKALSEPSYQFNFNIFEHEIIIKDTKLIIYILIFVFSFKTILNSFLIYFQSYTLVKAQNFISKGLIQNFFNTSYSFLREKKKSEIIRDVLHESRMFCQGYLFSCIKFFSEFIQIIFFLTFLIIFNPFITFFILFFIIISFLFFDFFLKPIVKKISNERHTNDTKLIEKLNNIIGAFKEIKLFGIEKILYKEFLQLNTKYLGSLAKQNILSQQIKYFAEFIIILFLLSTILLTINNANFFEKLPTISLITIILIRVSPIWISIFNSVQKIKYYTNSVIVIKKSLENIDIEYSEDKEKETDDRKFENISFNNVCYNFKQNIILRNANLNIKKNDFIGIAGKSGSGKSTLVDLMMGFIKPLSGDIVFNNKKCIHMKKYRLIFSYISDSSFLINDTILKNITFFGDFDEQKFNKVVKICNLNEFVEKFELGFDTQIGEDISNLSSGQKQRICIARALYKKFEVLILDEATNYLDKNNEKSILENIANLNTTKIIISHNDYNMKYCNKVYKIEDGFIK